MKPRRWKEDDLVSAVRNSKSYRQVLKKIGLVPAGGNYQQVKQYIEHFKLDISHFTGRAWSRGLKGIGKPILTLEQILVENSTFQSYKLKLRLYKAGLKPQYCEECGWAQKTESGYLPLELDHINGIRTDNRLENLRVLCPNCHSLKPTHRSRQRK